MPRSGSNAYEGIGGLAVHMGSKLVALCNNVGRGLYSMIKNIRRNLITAAVSAAFIAGLSLGAGPAVAADATPGCGADNQKVCTTSKATYRGKVKKSKPKGAFFDPRKGGEWWKCPSNRPRRTAYSVTDKRACATKRIIGEKLSRAEFKGKVTNPKPKGAFLDPRKGGEYWSCPAGYIRNLNPVTHRAACTVAPKYVCDGSNMAVRGKCYKKGACGARNQRPCLIVERIPSCKNGLAEDFIANKCIPAKIAGCLTLTRALKIAKGVGKAVDTVGKQISNFGSNKKAAKNKKNAKQKEYASSAKKQDLLALAERSIQPYSEIKTEMDRIGKTMKTSGKRIANFFTDPSYCTTSDTNRESRVAGFGLKPRKGFKKASLFDDLFIRSAHAATGEHFFMTYDVSVSGGVGIGGSFGLSFVTDYRGSNAGYISVGPGIVTNATIGAAIAIGFYPKVSEDSFKGWGWSFGAAGGPFKIVSGGIDFFFDEKFKDFQGFAVNVGGGVGLSPVDVNVSASHAWKL